jgi:hypothetical protein
MKKIKRSVVAILLSVGFMVGCTHQLKIKNLNTYYSSTSCLLDQPLRLGLKIDGSDTDGNKISKMTADALNRCNIQVTTVFVPSSVDVVANMRISSDYKGSGWNFLINFPGFLVWAPAWHGYNYTVSHNINVVLSDAKTGKTINTINVPVALDVRHADISRTWTEISWLEFGVIAFVGGVVFIDYDDDVTPMVTEKAGPVLADYIAQKISSILVGIKPAAKSIPPMTMDPAISVEKSQPIAEDAAQQRLLKLKQLLDQGLVTPEEYETHRQAIVNGMRSSSVSVDDSTTKYEVSDFRIVEYDFDARTGTGSVTVDISGKGFNARLWVVKNIGMICSSKNVALDAGNEAFNGAKYSILDESIKDGLLKITFQAVY